MKELTSCVTDEALVTYVYDECEPAERDAIAAHASYCVRCAEEIQSLRDTRAHLGAWIPPSASLGFRITSDEPEASARVLRPAAWWRQPLPAWAQLAAAGVIFAVGLGIGASRSTTGAPASQASAAGSAAASRVIAAPVAAVTSQDMGRLNERLRALEANQAQHNGVQMVRTAATIDDAELMARVQQLIDERITATSQQQRTENVRLWTGVARELEINRDAAQRLGLLEEEVLDHRQALRSIAGSPLVRVALQPTSSSSVR
jgi:hypothetical protein